MTSPNEFDSLRAALRDPSAYSEARGEDVRFEETHISVVALVGDRAYKIKKPFDLGFLDFSTPEKRRAACEDEVRLNRRLAPSWYLGVAPIMLDASGRARVGAVREPDDADEPARDGERLAAHAVVMRRLPEEGMLGSVLDRAGAGEATGFDLDDAMARLGEDLAAFHASCATGGEIDAFAAPDAVRTRIHRNVDEATEKGEAPRGPLSAALLGYVRAASAGAIEGLRDEMTARAGAGRAREGHGDLHTGNICLTGEGPVVFDCIEFSKRLRCMDVAAELAFLGMDLERRGRSDLSRALFGTYERASSDDGLGALQPLYRAHFACVRAKVTALRAGSMEEGTAAREEASEAAQRWLVHAFSYLAAPVVVLTCGLPASGKSHSARTLAEALRGELIQSDVVRKALAGRAPSDRAGAGDDAGMYSEDFTQRTYESMLASAVAAIDAGRSVVVDATFQTVARRAPFIGAAQAMGRPCAVLWRDIDDETARERLAARASDRDEPSDADWRVYRLLKPVFEPPGAGECVVVRADPGVSAHGALLRVCEALAGRAAG